MRTPREADQAYAAHSGSEDVVPKGLYCYHVVNVERDADGRPVMKTQVCPYWAMDPTRREQQNGYCALLQAANGEGHDSEGSLLWDQVKECGVNSDWDDAED